MLMIKSWVTADQLFTFVAMLRAFKLKSPSPLRVHCYCSKYLMADLRNRTTGLHDRGTTVMHRQTYTRFTWLCGVVVRYCGVATQHSKSLLFLIYSASQKAFFKHDVVCCSSCSGSAL